MLDQRELVLFSFANCIPAPGAAPAWTLLQPARWLPYAQGEPTCQMPPAQRMGIARNEFRASIPFKAASAKRSESGSEHRTRLVPAAILDERHRRVDTLARDIFQRHRPALRSAVPVTDL
jgi:hypothetical protein